MQIQVEKYGVKFEWDSEKAASNIRDHQVTFEEALTVFFDEYAEYRPDTRHAEPREVLIGRSSVRRMLLVVHVERGEWLRLISAREPKDDERSYYEARYRARRSKRGGRRD